jgi:2-dehydropantoate 2-reductase
VKIAVVGVGGVGGYFGGLLAQAGHEVSLILRGEHLGAVQAHGLRVRSVHGDFTVHPALATDDPQAVGVQEYVVVAVKHFHLAAAPAVLRPLIGPQTTLVPLLNGVDAHDILAAEFGAERVVGGLCSIVSSIEAPGVIRQESALRRVVVGELDRRRSKRVERIVRAWAEAGADARQAEDIHAALWTKFVFIAAFGGISALTRATAGELLAQPEAKQLLIDAMREVESVGRARGIALNSDVVDSSIALLQSFEPGATSSMQRDVAAGRPFELEAFSGTVARLGRQHGVPTPAHGTIYALLRPMLDRSLVGA